MSSTRSLWISLRIAIVVSTTTFFIALEGVNGSTPESFSVDGATWTVHKTDDKRVFYFNTATQQSTYTDPRKEAADERDRLVVMLAFALPFLLLLAGGGAYLMYLKVYKPEVLKPRKKKAGATAAVKRPTSPVKGSKADAAAASPSAAAAVAASTTKDAAGDAPTEGAAAKTE